MRAKATGEDGVADAAAGGRSAGGVLSRASRKR